MKNTWRMPGLLLVGAGVAAFVMCLAAFALGRVGVGIAATVVALLASGAGLAWLAMEGRRGTGSPTGTGERPPRCRTVISSHNDAYVV
jgi:FtsH-binding integral membrane protein